MAWLWLSDDSNHHAKEAKGEESSEAVNKDGGILARVTILAYLASHIGVFEVLCGY